MATHDKEYLSTELIEVCTCGHVITSEMDKIEHMASHYDSYRVGLAKRSAIAMAKIFPKRFIGKS